MAKRVVVDHANHVLEMLREVCKEKGIRVQSDPKDLAYAYDWSKARVSLLSPARKYPWEIARFELQQMPGCCAILTMSYVNTQEKEMNFAGAVELVAEAARRAAFGSLVLTQVVYCPVIKTNSWYSIVKDLGFEMSEPFINAKSGNKVVYLTKNLGQVEKMDGFEERILA